MDKLGNKPQHNSRPDIHREAYAILNVSPDGVVVFDTNHKIVYFNPSFKNMTAFTDKILAGMKLHDFEVHINQLLDKGKHAASFNISQHDDDTILHLIEPAHSILQCTSRITADDGHQVLFFRDVSHVHDLGRQMKSKFISLAAHKLRTPLVGILGFSELLLKRDLEKKQTKDALETIYRQSINLKQLLDDFLDIARLETRAGTDFHFLETTLENTLDELKKSLKTSGNNRNIVFKLPDDWPRVRHDSGKIKQALTQLVNNAVNYTRDDKKIIVSTVMRNYKSKPQFGIQIQDNGSGMSAEELMHAGERFYRGNNVESIPGSGLGIAMVKEITDIHQGKFEISSSKSKGTTATLWLPVIN